MKLGAAAVARVQKSPFLQRIEIGLVDRKAVRLIPFLFSALVPSEPEPFEVVLQKLDLLSEGTASRVEVFDAEHHRSLLFSDR